MTDSKKVFQKGHIVVSNVTFYEKKVQFNNHEQRHKSK